MLSSFSCPLKLAQVGHTEVASSNRQRNGTYVVLNCTPNVFFASIMSFRPKFSGYCQKRVVCGGVGSRVQNGGRHLPCAKTGLKQRSDKCILIDQSCLGSPLLLPKPALAVHEHTQPLLCYNSKSGYGQWAILPSG